MKKPLPVEWKYVPFKEKPVDQLGKRISGVYVIWETLHRKALYVGRGKIREHINKHLNDNNDPLSFASGEATEVAYIGPTRRQTGRR